MNCDVTLFQGAFGLLSVEGPCASEDLISLFDEMNASCSVKQVNEFASEFYARGTGPNNHERACSGGTVA